MAYLKIRKYLKKAPLISYIHETQDGTTLHLNGPIRTPIGLLKRSANPGKLHLELIDYHSVFAPFMGCEIDDSLPAIRELQLVMSAHMAVAA